MLDTGTNRMTIWRRQIYSLLHYGLSTRKCKATILWCEVRSNDLIIFKWNPKSFHPENYLGQVMKSFYAVIKPQLYKPACDPKSAGVCTYGATRAREELPDGGNSCCAQPSPKTLVLDDPLPSRLPFSRLSARFVISPRAGRAWSLLGESWVPTSQCFSMVLCKIAPPTYRTFEKFSWFLSLTVQQRRWSPLWRKSLLWTHLHASKAGLYSSSSHFVTCKCF